MMRGWIMALVASAALFGGGSPASGHAELERAIPAVGSTVTTAPTQVVLQFSEPIEAAFSRVEVTDSTGRRVDNGDGRPDPSDRTHMKVTLMPLAPGTYRVNWYALSVDTHRTEGDFTFTVRP